MLVAGTTGNYGMGKQCSQDVPGNRNDHIDADEIVNTSLMINLYWSVSGAYSEIMFLSDGQLDGKA